MEGYVVCGGSEVEVGCGTVRGCALGVRVAQLQGLEEKEGEPKPNKYT